MVIHGTSIPEMVIDYSQTYVPPGADYLPLEVAAQGGRTPIDTQRDGSEVNYQRSYDLSENINVMVIEP
jgi:hypothetical protein